jgi:hypothetical protein
VWWWKTSIALSRPSVRRTRNRDDCFLPQKLATMLATDLSGTHWATAIKFFVETTNLESHVLAAPKRAPNVGRLVAGLRRLRDAGVAEPD